MKTTAYVRKEKGFQAIDSEDDLKNSSDDEDNFHVVHMSHKEGPRPRRIASNFRSPRSESISPRRMRKQNSSRERGPISPWHERPHAARHTSHDSMRMSHKIEISLTPNVRYKIADHVTPVIRQGIEVIDLGEDTTEDEQTLEWLHEIKSRPANFDNNSFYQACPSSTSGILSSTKPTKSGCI